MPVDQYRASRRVLLGLSGFIGVFLLAAGVIDLLMDFNGSGLFITVIGLAECIITAWLAANTPARRR
jgi:hypothetical protein